MRIWITSFLVLFAIAELYQWMSHFTLPLPTFILGGALLAIASNYSKVSNWFQDTDAEPPVIDSANSPIPPHLRQSQSKPVFQVPRSISFTINRSGKAD